MVTTQLNETSTTTLLAITFDYDSSGKQDHCLYYAPGTARLRFIEPTLTERLPKFIPRAVLPLGLGLAMWI